MNRGAVAIGAWLAVMAVAFAISIAEASKDADMRMLAFFILGFFALVGGVLIIAGILERKDE